MFKNKWFTYAIALLIVYAVIRENFYSPTKPQETLPAKADKQIVQQIIKKDLKNQDLDKVIDNIDKQVATYSQNNTLKTTEKIENDRKAPYIAPANNSKPSFIEQKIINIANNLLQSKKGQELIESMLKYDPNNPYGNIDNPYNNITTTIIQKGSGPKAECGQKVKFHYIYKNLKNKLLTNSKFEQNQPKEIIIGSHQTLKGLEYALIGMQTGEIKQVVLPPSQAAHDKNINDDLVDQDEYLGFQIELNSIITKTPNFASEIQIFNKELGNRKSVYKCGDIVAYKYKIKKIDGTVLYDSTIKEMPIITTIGSNKNPYAINKALENMAQDSSRTIITPYIALQQNISQDKVDFLDKSIKLPKNELLLIEFYAN